MGDFIWIGKTDTPKILWDSNGEGFEELMDAVKDEFSAEHSSILFRKECLLPQPVVKATVAVCGLGFYQMYLNGQKVGDAVLSPLETHYGRLVLYDEFDVTDKIRPGANAFAVEVGNGRYSTPKKYRNWRAAWYGDPCLTVKITLIYADGSEEIISTDETWKCSYGAIFENCYYDGESRDGRREQEGWKEAGFKDSSWQSALRVEAPCDNVQKNSYFHIKKVRERKPVGIYPVGEGKTVYDFGENHPGWVKLLVRGEAGAKLTIHYGECITEDGSLNSVSNKRALNTDCYILNEEPLQEFEPMFTLHGFSAAEVSCEDGNVEVVEILACEVHAALEENGSFSCDNPELMRLHDVILRTQRSALMSAPYDCLQRDERLGWMGDAHVTSLTCLYNYNMQEYYKKWLEDMRLNAHTETGAIPFIAPWHIVSHAVDFSSGYAIVLWNYYLFYRDKEVLRTHCDTLIRYVEFLKSKGPIQGKTRYGDWMSVAEDWVRGDPASSSSMFYYYNLVILVKVLDVLGRKEEKELYECLKNQVKAAIQERFYDADKKSFDANTQFCLSMALKLGLIPKEDEPAILERLVADVEAHGYHLTTGIFGTQYLMEVLRDLGRQDVAMKLLLQKTYPGWLNMIEGRTTLPERWDGEAVQSQSHCMFGSVDSIFYSMLAGIRIGEEIVIEPYYAQELSCVKASLKLNHGTISVMWQRRDAKICTTVALTGDVEAVLKCAGGAQRVGQGRYVFEAADAQ